MNALRLNLFRIHETKHDHPMKKRALPDTEEKVTVAVNAVNGTQTDCPLPKKTEEKTKAETVLVKGMMCENCEKHVQEALKKVDGITDAKADHTTGKVEITFTKTPDEAAMKKAIEAADYEYKGVAENTDAAQEADTEKQKGEHNDKDSKSGRHDVRHVREAREESPGEPGRDHPCRGIP